MTRPTIVNYRDIQDPDDSTYPNSTELLSIGAPFSKVLGLPHLAIHHETLPPGRRTSYPHAHESEEEFVYVIEGAPDVWLDGVLHRLKAGDGVGLPTGTGQAHTVINNTSSDVKLLVVGEPSRFNGRLHYPLNPAENAAKGSRHWVDVPSRDLGPHDAMPDAVKK